MTNHCPHRTATPHGDRDYIQVGSYAQDAVCDQCGAAVRRIVRYPGLHPQTIIAYIPDQETTTQPEEQTMPKSAAAPPVELQPHNRQQLRSTLIWRREMEERAASRHWNGNLMRLSTNLTAETALQALRDHSFSAQPQDSGTKQAAAQCLRLLAQRPGERDPASIQPADPRLYEAAQKLKLLLETGKPNNPMTDEVRQELREAGNAILNRVMERIGLSEDDLFPEGPPWQAAAAQ